MTEIELLEIKIQLAKDMILENNNLFSKKYILDNIFNGDKKNDERIYIL